MDILQSEVFAQALGNTVDAVVITDMSSIIRYVNPAFTAITGFAAEEALGNKPVILRSKHTTPETYKAMWSVILAGGWWRGEIINVRKSGEEWHSYLSISQVRDASDTPVGYVGISRDITDMKRLEHKLREMSLEAIYMLASAADAKDSVTGSHLDRVRYYSEAIARRLGLPENKVEEIGYSSMMHDVGKLNVPDAILQKKGKLTPQEWEEMKRHPVNGKSILRDRDFYQVARDVAANHHERWDGEGYPEGKRGEAIPQAARIVTVADVYDALTSSRSYKDAWPEEVARDKIIEGRGSQFDPKVVDAFRDLCKEGVIGAIRRQFPPE